MPTNVPTSESSRALALAEAVNLDACLDIIESELKRFPELDGYMINLHTPEDGTLICVRVHLPAAMSSVEASFRNYRFQINPDDANGLAFTTGKLLDIHSGNLDQFTEATQTRFKRWAFENLLVIPIRHPGSARPPVGVFSLFSQTSRLPGELIEQVIALGESVATPLRLHEEITRWEERSLNVRNTEAELQSLLGFVAEMSNLTTDKEIYPRIQQEFLQRFDMDLATVFVSENELIRCVDTLLADDTVSWASDWAVHCQQLSFTSDIKDGTTSDVFLNNHSLYIANVPSILHLQMSEKDRAGLNIAKEIQCLALLPIRKHGRPIGVLWLASLRRTDALSSEQMILAQLLCDFLGSAIENARTYTLVERQRSEIESLVSALQNKVETLDHLANRDRLTGLFNFGSFEVEANKKIAGYRHQRHPLPLSLIMCDVDYFKRFNDTYGHVAGNVVLKEVAARIGRAVRDSDYVARYGGEEFAVLLPRCDIEAAARLAERIRANIADQPFIVDGVEHQITISLGCAQYALQFQKLADFTAHADSALYAAKHGGRNRVEKAPLD